MLGTAKGARRGGWRARVASEARLARWEIRHGRFQRSMAILAAISAIASGFEAYAQHVRGAFRHWLMWTPVWLTPGVVVAAVAALFSERAARRLLPIAAAASLIDGIIGFGYHLRGIGRLPGGFKLGRYNIVMGPPIFAPLLTCVVGVLAGLAALLREERLPATAVTRSKNQTRRPLRSLPQARSTAADVSQGRFQQGLAVVAAALAVLCGGEAYFEHLRGSFSQRVMWTPVWVTPPMVVAGVGAARSRRVAHRILPIAAAATFVDGVIGFLLHLRGLRQMPGGFANLRFNATYGPPLLAPLLFCSVGLLGLLASLLRRREG